MTANNIDNIFKFNFLRGAPDFAVISESRDLGIPVAHLRDPVISGARDLVKIRRDGILPKKIFVL